MSITPTLSWKPVEGATAYVVQGETNSEWRVLAWGLSVSTTSVKVGPLVKGTKYHWRVAAVNKVAASPWSTIRYFVTGTEEPELEAPILVSPANQATGVLHPAKLRWNPVVGALGYYVAVSRTPEFTTTVFTGSATSTFIEVPGLAKATTYYWRVFAMRPPVHGPSSVVWSFTTVAADGPAVPVLVSPANGAAGVALRPVLMWQAANAAASYYVQVSTSAEFAVTVFNAAVTTTSVEVPTLAKGTKYYWRVMAKNSVGQSAWSAVWWFVTNAATAPGAPVLSSPANGASAVSTTPALVWLAVSGATSYKAQVSTSPTFAPVVWSGTATALSTQASGLLPATKYYWRAQAGNAAGFGDWSATWCFITSGVEKPAAPVLYAVANGATAVPTNTHLVWLASARATRYYIQVSTSAEFSRITWAQEVNGGVTGAEPIGLLAGTTYYWRVMAANNIGSSAWSTVWHFTTKAAPPPSGS